MQVQLEQITRISDKIQQLLQESVALRKENEKLKLQLQTRKELLNTEAEKSEAFKQEIDTLKSQLAIQQMHSGVGWNEASKKEIENKLRQYIKEIDHCLAMIQE